MVGRAWKSQMVTLSEQSWSKGGAGSGVWLWNLKHPPSRPWPISLSEDPLKPPKDPMTFSHHYLRTCVQTHEQRETLHIETKTNKIALEHSTFVECYKLCLNDRGMVLRGLLAKCEKNLT